MDKNNILIEITSDGSCIAIYSDESPLKQWIAGDLKVTRLSDIEFDNEKKGWIVKFKNGMVLNKIYQSRIKALAAEMTYVEKNLTKFGEWVQSINQKQENNSTMEI